VVAVAVAEEIKMLLVLAVLVWLLLDINRMFKKEVVEQLHHILQLQIHIMCILSHHLPVTQHNRENIWDITQK
jgi:hypothetical protein